MCSKNHRRRHTSLPCPVSRLPVSRLNPIFLLYIINKLNPFTELSWDDDDWQIDGIKEGGGTESVKVQDQDVHGVSVQIKTDTISDSGSDQYLTVFFKSNGQMHEQLHIQFDDRMTYQFLSCNSNAMQFPTDFPTAVQKIWTFSLTDEPDTAITIDINGVRLAEMSANSCDKENWRESWTNTDYEEA